MLRIYNRRGPTRIELESRGDRACAVVRRLLEAETVEWPGVGLGILRGVVDFVNRSGGRPDELLEWWRNFVGSTERERLRGVAHRRSEPTIGGYVDGFFQQRGRTLLAVIRGLEQAGVSPAEVLRYLRDRAEHWAGRRWGPEDERRVLAVAGLVGSGSIGMPKGARPEECPF